MVTSRRQSATGFLSVNVSEDPLDHVKMGMTSRDPLRAFDYYCHADGQDWPCDFIADRAVEKVAEMVTEKVKDRTLEVALFQVLRPYKGITNTNVALRSDNIKSMVLQPCNKGCVEGFHWLVETYGHGGVPLKFEGLLLSST